MLQRRQQATSKHTLIRITLQNKRLWWQKDQMLRSKAAHQVLDNLVEKEDTKKGNL